MNQKSIPDLSNYIIDGKLSQLGIKKFQAVIYDYYAIHKRDFPWRETTEPYFIVVSEIMLQQTQAERVIQKYVDFIAAFPTITDLASASLINVLALWIGLGYNRRAMSLQLLAQRVISEFEGHVPNDPNILVLFKGIGPNTAGSICAFAFNQPTVFIETNIRSVFIHLFFKDKDSVHDGDIMPLIEQTNDLGNARQWYYALMDYGVMLKKQFKNPSRKSMHHAKQSTFEGSDRQIRGRILRFLVEQGALTYQALDEQLGYDPRVASIMADLLKEKLIVKKQDLLTIMS